MSKDWTGDNESAFRMLGASNHTDEERESQTTTMPQTLLP